ncbi:MAG TPA: hypothetical protein VET26_09780 [Candidatus Sulfotelmatobacter sp.]|nr:hypothetical protein [Candidatus Sulfotelmatobacter sp.]
MSPTGVRIPTRFVALAAVVAVAILVVLVVATASEVGALNKVTDVANGLAAFAAAGACFWAARRSQGPFRRGWALMSAACVAWGLGCVAWTVAQLWMQIAVPFPSVPDV